MTEQVFVLIYMSLFKYVIIKYLTAIQGVGWNLMAVNTIRVISSQSNNFSWVGVVL